MSKSLDVKVVEDRAGLWDLKEEWETVAPPKNCEPWQSFSWIAACADTYSKEDHLHVITVRRNGQLTAIAPLVLGESNQPLRPLRLEFLGGGELKEPNRFISSDPVSLEVLIDYISAERTYPIRLSRVPTDGDVLPKLTAKFRKSGWITKALSMPYPYLELGSGREIIKKSLRDDLKRARRKAEKRGPVTSEVVAPQSPEGLRDRLRDAFLIESSGWKGKNNTAILCSDTRRAFFEHLAQAALKDGTLRLVFLKIGNVEAAVHYAIETKNEYWLLNIGYREDFRECSPGNLLLEETILDAASRGLSRYNFLGKEEAWTQRWTSAVTDSVVLAAYRPNRVGVRAIMSDALYIYHKRRKDRIAREIKRGKAVQAEGTRVLHQWLASIGVH